MKKAKIGQKIFDVLSPEEFEKSKSSYLEDPSYIAIQLLGGVYPLRKFNDFRVGAMYSPGLGFMINPPEDGDETPYSEDNIIDFENVEGIKEAMILQDKLHSAEREILTTVDNVFSPKILETDTPEMKGLKEAVIAKHIDLDKYEQRFGYNYNNDKRLFNKNSITMPKLKMMFDVLDMKGTLIIEDKSSDVPNPIGRKIEIDLTEDNIGYEDEE